MRLDVLAIGSRGDVQPYLALALGLQRAGHKVRVITLGGFQDLVKGRGLDHLEIGESPRDLANTDEGRAWVTERGSARGFLRGFVKVANSLVERGIATYWEHCQDVEAIIASPMAILVGSHCAERLKVPLIQAQLAPPVLPTRYDWNARKTPATAVKAGLNVLIHTAFHFLIWTKLRRNTNKARKQILNLAPASWAEPIHAMFRRRDLLLGGYSPAVVPRLPDWSKLVRITGYWFLDSPTGWSPPQDLADFLAAGPAPVFIGFGSTPFPQPEAATEMLIRAVSRSGMRCILLAGGSGLPTGRLSDSILSVDAVPHDWLFARVCAAVHHGGAGVTGAVLRAGLPSVAVPVFADQPFWAERVHQLGAGPRPIPARRLSDDNLAEALLSLKNPEMRRRADAIGQAIRKEDGVTQAVEAINEFLGAGHQSMSYQHAH